MNIAIAVETLNRNYIIGSNAYFRRNELTFQAMATLLIAGGGLEQIDSIGFDDKHGIPSIVITNQESIKILKRNDVITRLF